MITLILGVVKIIHVYWVQLIRYLTIKERFDRLSMSINSYLQSRQLLSFLSSRKNLYISLNYFNIIASIKVRFRDLLPRSSNKKPESLIYNYSSSQRAQTGIFFLIFRQLCNNVTVK